MSKDPDPEGPALGYHRKVLDSFKIIASWLVFHFR
jgi:hypothetical protein